MSKNIDGHKIDPKLAEEMAKLDGALEKQDDEQILEDDIEDEASIEDEEELVLEDDSEEVEEIKSEEVSEEEKIKAKKHGHLSKEEYLKKRGTLEGYKDEKEFNKFGDLYPDLQDNLKEIKKKLDQRDRELEASIKYIENVREREREAAKQELARQFQIAQQNGDMEAVKKLAQNEVQINYLEQQEKQQEQERLRAQRELDFKTRNPWYGVDQEMTNRAADIDTLIRNGRYSHKFPMPTNYEQLGTQIELIINEEFKDRLNNQKSKQEIQNESPRIKRSVSSSKSLVNKTIGTKNSVEEFKSLPRDLRDMYHAIKRINKGNYTVQEYIVRLKKDGVI